MRRPEHTPRAKPRAAFEARFKKILALLLLPTVAALLPACGGENPSSQREAAAAPDPGAAASATPTGPTGGANGSTNVGRQSAAAPGTGERFGMGPAGGPEQGGSASPRTEPPTDDASRVPAAQEGPLSPAPPAAPSPSDAPEPAPPSVASEQTRAEPDDTSAVVGDAPAPSTPAPLPERREEASVAEPAVPEAPPGPEAAPEQDPGSGETVPALPDTTMYLTVPALGLERAPVVSDSSTEAMDRGVIHVPGTQFPWLPSGEGGSNTFLAAHRVGYPGTGSDRVFYDLPALALGDEVTLTDSNGRSYEYRVAEASEVSPYDTWVANPVPGRDLVTLQTCIEDFGAPWGEGPDWAARYVVRAERV